MPTPFKFRVVPRGSHLPDKARLCAYLIDDNWDDFTYKTTFALAVFDAKGKRHDLGLVKIGHPKVASGQRVDLPSQFTELTSDYFSLGQSDEYYTSLRGFDREIRDAVLEGLGDIVASPSRRRRAMKHKITKTSLLRSVSSKSVTGQFKRILEGAARSTRFSFTFTSPSESDDVWRVPPLSFDVKPDSVPPTNVHALIGRNGVGKSHLLHSMARSLTGNPKSRAGRFESNRQDDGDEPLFANVVSVSFSAFDDFPPLEVLVEKRQATRYFYIGLSTPGKRGKVHPPKTVRRLAQEFALAVAACSLPQHVNRWRRALQLLESDPLFRDEEISSLTGKEGAKPSRTAATKLFSRLSAGHKIVLLTITRLVEVVEEKTLVLLDEPETHLHPPLLSAFVRALSDLLIHRNAVALVATHSPVVLQEVPRACVWVLRRSGRQVDRERPETETFGENVGVLTREVFRLEAAESGFQQLLNEAAAESATYEDAVDSLGGSLGAEARAVLQAVMMMKGDAIE